MGGGRRVPPPPPNPHMACAISFTGRDIMKVSVELDWLSNLAPSEKSDLWILVQFGFFFIELSCSR